MIWLSSFQDVYKRQERLCCLVVRMADNQRIPPVTAFTEYQLDVTSDTGLPVQTVSQGVCNIVNPHTGFHFPEINLVVTHAFRFKMLYRFHIPSPVPAFRFLHIIVISGSYVFRAVMFRKASLSFQSVSWKNVLAVSLETFFSPSSTPSYDARMA